ncbi:alpha-2-macroglobulin family protein [Thalassobius sp. S69A]|uniref:alpha-2-macroglobulin family protein n=1 Tax=unclassified Thalassovita TaxID=2619711 RepID=UPI000C0F26B9|nr:PAN domain-containing protein [Paracoccaceae bacterium]MBT26592.1 PAN domain-containing protein [Paracoccaceae bacterium]
MRRILSAVLSAFLGMSAAVAADEVPDKRLIVTSNVDFYGADLGSLFDTTYQSCVNMCLADDNCRAFTFNSRSKACFAKSSVSDRQPYDGAWSAEVVVASQATKDLAALRAGDLGFVGTSDMKRALEQAHRIGGVHPLGQYSAAELLDAAQTSRAAGDWLNTMRWTGGAVANLDRSDLWAEYARLSLLIQTKKSADRRKYADRARLGSVNAYLRAQNAAQQVSALQIMADALEKSSRGRDMIHALRLAQQLQPNRQDIQETLDKAIAKYGFRITDHKVENDLATPRICAEFSEPLVKTGVDYATYLRLPESGMAVQASGNEICVEGAEHGNRYRLTFRAGLPAQSGEKLIKDVDLTLYVRDRSPSIRFPGRGYVLPRTEDAGLPIETVNLSEVALKLRRVSDRNLLRAIQDSYFGRPLTYWEEREFSSEIAEDIWTGSGQVQSELNRDMTTRLPMGDVIRDLPAGIYALSAAVPGGDPYDDPGATQWFVLSDLGVSSLSGVDGMHVFVRSLKTAQAEAGVKVSLLSSANRVLDTVQTDADGHALFEAGLTRGTGGGAPALLVVEKGDQDIAFLSLKDPAFDLSDRGVEGREPAPPIDVFLSTDRGAYRAGETVYATVLARDGVARSLTGLPITAILTRPDGVEYARHLSARDMAGGHVFQMPLGATVPRGTWRLAIKADTQAAPLSTAKFLVEDFLPERIDFDMGLPEGTLRLAEEPSLDLTARYLFGAPGAGLKAEALARLSETSVLEAYPGYRFGRYDRRFSPRTEYLGDGVTDADGKLRLPLNIGNMAEVNGPLSARITVSMYEGSGRPVERQETRVLAPEKPLIGIKPLFDGVVPEGTEAALQIIGLDGTLTPAPMQVRWTINRVERRYQWYQQYGNWEWEPITTRKRVASGDVMLGTDPLTVTAPVEWGRYELVVQSLEDDSVSASASYAAGWYAPADVTTTPDMLELSLDRPDYESGDTATLRIVPRYAGTALVTVMSNRVIAMKTVQVQKGENLIPLDVTDEWGAGAYVSASVIRPMDVAAGRNPARAMGLSYAQIDPGEKQLNVRFDAPPQADPRGTLQAAVQVDGIREGETAYVTVAAVDVGILNLTGFQSPDPSGHYFGQRRLGVEIRDVYGRLIDGMNGALGQVRSGGDAAAGGRFQSPPPTEELVAYFSGPVQVGTDGRAEVSFDLPAFNGTVRLMAIAWSDTAVGQAEADVLVRDPVVITASLPRFLAPGDTSRLLLEIVHATGPAGRMGLDVSATGVTLASALPSGLELSEKAKEVLSVPVTAGDVGDHVIRVALTTPDGRQLVKELTVPVRQNDPAVSTTQRLQLASGDTFMLDRNVFAGMQAGTGQATFTAGPLAALNAPALLASLNRYPYGCTEQVTSKAMPLLYLSSVAQAMGLGNSIDIDKRISQAVDRVLTRQSSNGAFGLWRAESDDFWLDAYVSDFLSRARAAGHTVPDLAFRLAMDNLRNRLNYAADFDSGGQEIAYALLVLAREGAASMSDLRYYADVKGDAFSTPLAAAQLGAALAAYGDQTRADAMFTRAARMIQPDAPKGPNLWRADYGTHLRDAAGVLALAVESGSSAVDSNALASRIGAAGRGLSTQESVWALMAAQAMVTDPGVSGLEIDGAPATGPLVRMLEDEVGSQPALIRNTRAAPVQITLTTTGVPEVPLPAGGYGYGIARRYYTPEGVERQLDGIKTGERLVVVLTVTPFEKGGARLMVNDPLPAGLEIDNPSLLRSGDIRQMDWLDTAYADMAEFRADRFLAAVDWRRDKPFQLAYIVRAISPGAFHHPAATVEDMYRPQYHARTETGRVAVSE